MNTTIAHHTFRSARKAARRFLAVMTVTGIAAGAALAVPATPAHAVFTGCDTDCINPVNFRQLVSDKAGLFAEFTTTVPVKATLKVTDINGTVVATGASVNGYYLTSMTIPTARTLNQGQGYVASLTVTDQDGKQRKEDFSITALQRTVTVEFGTLKVTEDSDVGAGEISARTKLGDNMMTLFPERSISAPYSKSLGTVFTATKVPSSSKLYVQLTDDDIDFGDFCTSGTGFSYTSGSNNCYDWATGDGTMGSLPEEKGSVMVRNAPVIGYGPIEFSVDAKITVTIS